MVEGYAEPAVPSITAWEKDGLQVAFDFSKPAGSPGVTDIDATYTNSGTETVSDFALQVGSVAYSHLLLFLNMSLANMSQRRMAIAGPLSIDARNPSLCSPPRKQVHLLLSSSVTTPFVLWLLCRSAATSSHKPRRSCHMGWSESDLEG